MYLRLLCYVPHPNLFLLPLKLNLPSTPTCGPLASLTWKCIEVIVFVILFICIHLNNYRIFLVLRQRPLTNVATKELINVNFLFSFLATRATLLLAVYSIILTTSFYPLDVSLIHDEKLYSCTYVEGNSNKEWHGQSDSNWIDDEDIELGDFARGNRRPCDFLVSKESSVTKQRVDACNRHAYVDTVKHPIKEKNNHRREV